MCVCVYVVHIAALQKVVKICICLSMQREGFGLPAASSVLEADKAWCLLQLDICSEATKVAVAVLDSVAYDQSVCCPQVALIFGSQRSANMT